MPILRLATYKNQELQEFRAQNAALGLLLP